MTIEGVISSLNGLMKAEDVPIYYKPAIKTIIDTIIIEWSNKWIPVSERLPEEDKDVQITYKYSGKKLVTMAYKESNGWRFENDGWIPDELVIAWMPLPKPYEPQESEDDNERKDNDI